jgi:hypothetical protein
MYSEVRMTRYERCVVAAKRLSREVNKKREEVGYVYPHPEVVKLERKWMAVVLVALPRAERDIWRR